MIFGNCYIFAARKYRRQGGWILLRASVKARQLEKAGAPERAIWSDTGWFKGADGKWRFEIDDSGASVDVGKIPSGMSMIGDLPKARGVVAHGRLFDAYPEVADNTYMGRVSDGGGSFSDMSNRGPYKGLVNLNPNGHEGANSVALHELQHAVQQREGFARGGSPSQFTQLPPDFRLTAQQLISVDETAKRLGESVDDVARLSLEPTLAQRVNELVRSGQWDANVNEWRQNILPPQQQYERLAGEAEARAVQSRMDMTPEQRRASFPFDSYDVPRDSLIIRR